MQVTSGIQVWMIQLIHMQRSQLVMSDVAELSSNSGGESQRVEADAFGQ